MRQNLAAVLLLFALIVVARPLQAQEGGKQPTYRLLGPQVVAQGESFTGVVIEQRDGTSIPLAEGSQVSFNGTVVDVKAGGEIQIPALTQLKQTVLAPLLLGHSQTAPTKIESYPVTVLAVPKNIATRVYRASGIVTQRAPFYVQGQGLNNVKDAALINEQTRIPLGHPIGSSLELIYPQAVATPIPKGTYRYVTIGLGGRQLQAPNPVSSPTLKLSGTAVEKKGTRGFLTVTSDHNARIQLTGGEPQITLSERQFAIRADQPKTIPFTANEVGQYTVDAVAFADDNEDIPKLVQQKLQKQDSDDESDGHSTVPGPIIEVGNPPPSDAIKLGVLLERVEPNWIPEPNSSTHVKASIWKKDPDTGKWAPSSVPDYITLSFVERSSEPGNCLNSPNRDQTPDLYFPSNENTDFDCTYASVDGEQEAKNFFNRARTKQQVTSCTLSIRCEDWGSFSKVTAAGDKSVVLARYGAEVSEAKNPEDGCKTVPRDDGSPRNHIADAWEEQLAESGAPVYRTNPKEDEDNTPQHDPDRKGDGLSDYEEYRGFYVRTPSPLLPPACVKQIGDQTHIRTDWNYKDLFICRDDDALDYSFYEYASKIRCHSISPEQYISHDERFINFNHKTSHHVDQHGVHVLFGQPSHGGAKTYGLKLDPATTGEEKLATADEFDKNKYDPATACGPPRNISFIVIKTLDANKLSKSVFTALARSKLAHELGHATGLRHHGDEPDFVMMNIEKRAAPLNPPQEDFSTPTTTAQAALGFTTVPGNSFELQENGGLGTYPPKQPGVPALTINGSVPVNVGNKYNRTSGDVACIMRYGNEPPAVYFRNGDYHTVPSAETPRRFCDSPKATLYNIDIGAGDCKPGRGDCFHKLFVSDQWEPRPDTP